MKKLILSLLLLVGVGVSANAQGVIFAEISLEEALEMAQKEQKMVFVDCYTSWCVPCKQMVKNVFPLEECGDYMNDKFISIKKDMESEEGKVILSDYNVRVFPTYLIIKPSGELQYSFSGSMSCEEFIEKVAGGLAQKKSSDQLIEAYNSGEASTEDLFAYLVFLFERSDTRAMEPVLEEVQQRLTTAQKCTEEYWSLMEITTDLGFIADNYDAIKVGVAPSTLERRLPSIAESYIYNQVRYKSRNLPVDSYEQMASNLRTVGLASDELLAYAKASEACCSRDYKLCMSTALEVHDRLGSLHQATTLRFIMFSLPKEKSDDIYAEVCAFVSEYKSRLGECSPEDQELFDATFNRFDHYANPNAPTRKSSH